MPTNRAIIANSHGDPGMTVVTTFGAGTLTVIEDPTVTTQDSTGSYLAITPANLVKGGFGGTSGRVVYETTAGALTDSSNLTFDGSNMAVGGNVSLAGATPTISTASTTLVLKQTGDTYGEVGLKFVNRDGGNGAVFYNAGLGLVDFAFQSSGVSHNSSVRVEGRSTIQLGAGNSSGGYNEIQLLPDVTSAAPITGMACGVGSLVLCPPDLVISTITILQSMATPRVGIYVRDPQGVLHLQPKGTSQVGFIAQGASSQSGDLTQWQNSSAAVLSGVKASGEIYGPIAWAYVAKTTTYTATAQDSFFAVSASSPWTLTLPAASAVAAGHQYTFKKTDNNANTITVARAGSDTIDGATSYAGLSAQYKYLRIVSDGSANWWNVGNN